MQFRALSLLVCLSYGVAIFGCTNIATTGEAAGELVGGCADSELNSKAVLYFGPSNQIGPGSIWSRLGPQGGYQPQWRMQDLEIDTSLIGKGRPFQCNLSRNSQFATIASLSVVSAVANASAGVKADFSRAKTIDISVTAAAWDTIWAGPYIAKLRSVDDATIRRDVLGKNRLVLRRALRVDGYRVLLDFDADAKAEIKAKYAGQALGQKTLGEAGAEFSASWTNDDRLELTASGGVYVAGEFAELMRGDLVSTKGSERIEDLGDKAIKPFERK